MIAKSIFVAVILMMAGTAQANVWETFADAQAKSRSQRKAEPQKLHHAFRDPNKELFDLLTRQTGQQIAADMRKLCLPRAIFALHNPTAPGMSAGLESALSMETKNADTSMRIIAADYLVGNASFRATVENSMRVRANLEARISYANQTWAAGQQMMSGIGQGMGMRGGGGPSLGGNASQGIDTFRAVYGSDPGLAAEKLGWEQNQYISNSFPGSSLNCGNGMGTIKIGATETTFNGDFRVRELKTIEKGITTTVFPANNHFVIELAMGGGTTLNGLVFVVNNAGHIEINKTNLDVSVTESQARLKRIGKKLDTTNHAELHRKIMEAYREAKQATGINFLQFAANVVADATLRTAIADRH